MLTATATAFSGHVSNCNGHGQYSRLPRRTCRKTGLISELWLVLRFAELYMYIFFYDSQYMCLLMAHAFFHIFLLTSDEWVCRGKMESPCRSNLPTATARCNNWSVANVRRKRPGVELISWKLA